MPLQSLLIADDLTGACDAAVHFAARGRRTAVSHEAESSQPECDVLAISTESRDFGAPAIESLWSRIAARWGGASNQPIKKIDSTLRGNPGLEIETAMNAFGLSAAVITPALPVMDRIVLDGWLHLRGAPDFPNVDIVQLLRSQGLRGCVRARAENVRGALELGVRAVVADAATDQDLDRIVTEAQQWQGPLLWAGSAGLVAAMARSLPAASPAPASSRAAGPVIFCLGSDHRVTLAQEQALTSSDRPHTVLRIARDSDSLALRDTLAQTPAAPLLLSGGDTASLILRALGAHSIDLMDEVLPGLPRGVLRGGDFDGRTVVTKSGGFGRPDALLQVADFFPCGTN